MGVKADLKEARARMQAGQPAEALSMIQTVLDSGSSELKDTQTMYAVLVTSGLAGLAAEDYAASELSFRRAGEVVPDAPQAWKGLIDCLERAGKVDALPDALIPAVEIAEGKKNYTRARGLRLRLAEVLQSLGRVTEALEALLRHLDNADAAVADAENPEERLTLLLYAAILEDAVENAAVARRVDKRLAKDSGIGASGNAVSNTSASRATLIFEYRAKALAKDDADDGPVGKRLKDGLEALEAATATATRSNKDAQTARNREKVTQFYRTFLRRAVQRAEGRGDSSSAHGWQEVLRACASVTKAVGVAAADADDGWVSTATLLASTYHQQLSEAQMLNIAKEGKEHGSGPWLSAESNLYLAWNALSAGDGAQANSFMEATEVAFGTMNSPDDAGISLSGPGCAWRELSLRCLINERLGYPGADRNRNVALGKVEVALGAFEASCRVRGVPVAAKDPLGGLTLARASLLLQLGRMEESRSAIETVSDSAVHSNIPSAKLEQGGGAKEDPVRRMPCLHCRALCVASDVDLAEWRLEDAKAKLRLVVEADGGFSDALTRLGWILLGCAGVGGTARRCVGKQAENGDAKAALPLLERAAQEESGCSQHAFRLAR